MTPKISVLTPSYNSSKTIDRSIQSVLNQDYPNFEHVIIDGDSQDGTLDVLNKYNHLTWQSQPDKGQSDAMNKAFDLSSGDIVVYLNADDWFAQNTFHKVCDFFNKNPTCKFLVGDLIKVYEQKEIRDKPKLLMNDILDFWPCHFPLNPVSYFYKREIQDAIGPFPLDNDYTMDYWFLLRAFKKFKIDYLPEVFGYFQLFDNKSSDITRTKKDLRKVRNEFLDQNPMIKFKYKGHKIGQRIAQKIARFY